MTRHDRRLASALAVLVAMAATVAPTFSPPAAMGDGPRLSKTTVTFVDTVLFDRFSEVRIESEDSDIATITGPDGIALVAVDDEQDAPPNTDVDFYNDVVRTSLGKLYLEQDRDLLVLIPDDDAINALPLGTTVTIPLVVTFNGGAQETLTLEAIGAYDAPVVQLARRDDLTRGLPRAGDTTFEPCDEDDPDVGYPYRIEQGRSPGGERCHLAFDGLTTTKYLNFKGPGSGVRIDMGERVIVTEIQLTAANDSDERDPATFSLAGSDDGFDGPWSAIVTDLSLGALPDDRFEDYDTVSFTNRQPYRYYRLTFPTLRSNNDDMQVSRIRLGGGTEAFGPTVLVNSAPLLLEPTVEVRSVDTGAAEVIASATVEVTDCVTGDTLALLGTGIPDGLGVTVASDGCTLSVTGDGSFDTYESVFRRVGFATSAAGSPPSRTVSWSVTDARGVSVPTGTSISLVQVATTLTDAERVSQPIAFDPVPVVTLGSGPIVLTTSPAFVPVVLSSATPEVCTVTGDEVTPIATGTCRIDAMVDTARSAFAAATASVEFTVLQGAVDDPTTPPDAGTPQDPAPSPSDVPTEPAPQPAGPTLTRVVPRTAVPSEGAAEEAAADQGDDAGPEEAAPPVAPTPEVPDATTAPDASVEVVVAADRSGGTARTVLITLLLVAALVATAAAVQEMRRRRGGSRPSTA